MLQISKSDKQIAYFSLFDKYAHLYFTLCSVPCSLFMLHFSHQQEPGSVLLSHKTLNRND